MTRYVKPPFQFDRPLYCKQPQQFRGRTYQAGAVFKWKEMSVDPKIVQVMYVNDQFYHSDEKDLERKPKVVGDGLEELDIESLNALVNTINAKVAEATKNEADYLKKKCKFSRLKDKQIGLIRFWRTQYGNME